MRVLGIDYGHRRIGLAVSDESQTVARELEIVAPKEFWKRFDGILTVNEIETIVLGYPLNMSGQATVKTKEVEMFEEKIRDTVSVPVVRVDERLSSSMAESISGGKKNIDSLAAQIILQNYLDKQKGISE
jgi:putative holliday junction resolvase